MKKYKRSTGMAACFFFIEIYFYIFCAVVPVLIYDAIINNENIFLKILEGFVLILIFIIFFVLIAIIINLISKIFTKSFVIIENNEIKYNKETINLDKVMSINLFLGEMRRYGKGDPVKICIMENINKYITISNPSYILLFKIYKILKNKNFEIENIKKKTLLYPLLAFLSGILMLIILLIKK
jgi:hypothetical protein